MGVYIAIIYLPCLFLLYLAFKKLKSLEMRGRGMGMGKENSSNRKKIKKKTEWGRKHKKENELNKMAEIRKDVVQAGFLEAFSRLIESLDLLNAKH